MVESGAFNVIWLSREQEQFYRAITGEYTSAEK